MHHKNNFYIFIAIFILIISQSCIRFSAIDQPDTAEPNSHFDVNITLNISCDSTGNDKAVYFGILIPNGWTVSDTYFL